MTAPAKQPQAVQGGEGISATGSNPHLHHAYEFGVDRPDITDWKWPL